MASEVVGLPDPVNRRAVITRRLAVTALLAVLVAVPLQLFAIHTEAGQRHDSVAFEGRRTEAREIRSRADDILRLVTRASLPALGGSVVLVALARRRWRLALAAGVVMAGTVLSAEVLKDVLVRPDLLVRDHIPFNSWPSGHVSIAASVSLAGVMVVPRRWRTPAAVAGAVFTGSFGISVIVSGWHRPSDALGAFLLALAWASASSAALVVWRGPGPERASPAEERSRQANVAGEVAGRTLFAYGAVALVVGFALYAVQILVDRGHEIGAVERHGALLVALVLVVGGALMMISIFLWVLRDVVLDPPA